MLEAFRSYSVVALSEGTHGNEQGGAFREALLRDPRFVERVNDVLLEGVSARYQDVIDRYVSREDVPLATMRHIWEDTTQVQAARTLVTAVIPAEFRLVRALNASLSPARRIRILLGDPPIDWDQVRTREDHAKWLAKRDTYPAEIIEREVIAKRRRVLVIFGNMHLQRRQLLANYEPAADGPAATVVSAIERNGRKTRVFSIWAATDAELSEIQPNVRDWPVPSLARVRGTILGVADFTRYVPPPAQRFFVHDGQITPLPRDQWRTLRMEDQFDAILYLGPQASITVPPMKASAAVCADTQWLAERIRRVTLVGLPPPAIEAWKQLCSAER